MMSADRVGGAVVEIPATTKKVVQDLKEVVGNSEEEIYVMLKECNMDPNETAQRLLNQGDPFHEVKRKRDKKKDSGVPKDDADVRVRAGSGGNHVRGGGRGGSGRGSSLPRFGLQEHGGSGSRGRGYGRDNGVHSNLRGSSVIPSSGSHGQAKPSSASLASAASPTAAPAAANSQAQALSTGRSLSGVENGSSRCVRPAPAPQGAWAAGHGTMADILKAQAAPSRSIQGLSATLPFPAFPGVQASVRPSYPEAAPSVELADASEGYSSSADPVLHSSVDLLSGRAQCAIETVGNQRPICDRLVSTSSVETALGTGAAGVQPTSAELSAIPGAAAVESRDAEAQVEVAAVGPASPVSVISPVSSGDLSAKEAGASTDGESGQGQQAEGRRELGGSQYHGQPLYAAPLQPVGTHKGTGVLGLEWKAKGPGQSSVGASSEGGSQSLGAVDPAMIVQSFQALNLPVEEPVIIPTHLRVPEADRSHLSFGSFGSNFSTGFVGLEEVEKTKHVEAIGAEAPSSEQAAPASLETQVEMVQSYGYHQGSTAVDNMSRSVEAASVGYLGPTVAVQEQQQLKPDPMVQQSPAYFLGASNYPGFGLMPQMPGGQYGYEQTESQGQDVCRIPGMVPAYDPTSSYYTSAFRGADADRLYPPYALTNTSNKYVGNMGLMTAPSLPSSQEGVGPVMVSAGFSSQAGSNVQSAQAIPQQGLQQLPMHYSQSPSGHFGNFVGYQYVPQTYPYLQPPYPHHMYNSNNSAYAQLPVGSSYPATAGSSYTTGGITAVKFPVPQFKSVAGAGNAPTSAPGIAYGGYTTTPSGYGSNAAVSAGSTSGYEDVNMSHYKDSTLYIPSQQGDSSTVWIPTSMPRDMGPSGAMQTSSYYNVASQGQQSGYAQHSQQQPMHGHVHPNAAFANLYHPSQAGPAVNHQILQQPQCMGPVAGNTQAGAYQQQQPQRSQQTWNNSSY